MDDRNAQVGWSEAQWNRVREEVLEAWQRVRVAGSFLPIYGPLPPSTTVVPSEVLKPDGSVDDEATAVVLEIALPVILSRQQISEEDLSLFKVTTSAAEAVEEITGFYRLYHSSRLVGPDFVMRLHRPLEPALVTALGREFRDLVVSGDLVQTAALPEEHEQEPELDALPRLVFRLNQGRAGRLRQLIDRVNREG